MPAIVEAVAQYTTPGCTELELFLDSYENQPDRASNRLENNGVISRLLHLDEVECLRLRLEVVTLTRDESQTFTEALSSSNFRRLELESCNYLTMGANSSQGDSGNEVTA